MSISHLLEDFGAIASGTPVALTDVSLEEQKLESFEKGYQAGWDDAVKAGAEDKRRISADLAQNLRDLSFTYEEAHQAAFVAIRPLLDQMVSKVLPRLVQKTLGLHISEQLHRIAEDHGNPPVEIVSAPADQAVLDHLRDEITTMDISLSEDANLAAGQVYLRFGASEREINLDEVLSAMDQALSGFFEHSQRNIA